jgi:hypothetical protein
MATPNRGKKEYVTPYSHILPKVFNFSPFSLDDHTSPAASLPTDQSNNHSLQAFIKQR